MTLLYIFILSFLVSWTKQDGIGMLEVVSDLLPQDCFVKEENYIVTNGLAACGSTFSTKEVCAKYFDLKKYKTMVYRPTECKKDGSFGPKQCKGERTTGRCFCFSDAGERLFGQEWWSKADNMTCACSRRKADMTASQDFKNLYFNSLHCNSLGNYEALQCDVVSEQCWCADEMTGEMTSPIVPDKAMIKLPCYNSLTLGTQYLRQCESKKHAQNKILNELNLHGTTADFGAYLCDDDGSYGVYAIFDGLAYCTWRDNSKLGAWQPGEDYANANCYCARDSRIFSDAGKTQQQKCGPAGNYQKFQTSASSGYCIDIDGYRKSPSGVNVTDEVLCSTYVAYNS